MSVLTVTNLSNSLVNMMDRWKCEPGVLAVRQMCPCRAKVHAGIY